MNALWKDMANLKLSDRGMIWNSDLVESLELQNCMINAQQVRHNHRRQVKHTFVKENRLFAQSIQRLWTGVKLSSHFI